MNQAATLLREARTQAGLTQRRLALRAATSQDAISRIERGVEAPGLERLGRLLLLCGARLEVGATQLEPPRPDREARARTPAELLRESASWNLAATRLEVAGEAARAAGHPATRRRGHG